MGRRLSLKDMSAAKHAWEVYNSHLKRSNSADHKQIVREDHVVCGCGEEGCIFIATTRDESVK